jgi:hypothetical protein
MTCKFCGSAKLSNFKGELCIPLPGLKNLRMDPIRLFPRLLVCLNCGIAVITIPESELGVLAKEKAASVSVE